VIRVKTGLRRWGTALVCVALAPAACGTTATIQRRDALPLEGEIVSGSLDTLIVQTDTGVELVPRSAVVEIDHPGNALRMVGLGLFGLGLVNIVVAAPTCHEKGTAFCTGVFLPAAVGAVLMAFGEMEMWRSRAAAADTTHARGVEILRNRPPPSLVPPAPEARAPADD
jgi:hypothetical protein